MKLANIISTNVRKYRKEAGISQERLAELAGISPRYLSLLENSSPNVTVGTIEKIAQALGEDPQQIVCATDGLTRDHAIRLAANALGRCIRVLTLAKESLNG